MVLLALSIIGSTLSLFTLYPIGMVKIPNQIKNIKVVISKHPKTNDTKIDVKNHLRETA